VVVGGFVKRYRSEVGKTSCSAEVTWEPDGPDEEWVSLGAPFWECAVYDGPARFLDWYGTLPLGCRDDRKDMSKTDGQAHSVQGFRDQACSMNLTWIYIQNIQVEAHHAGLSLFYQFENFVVNEAFAITLSHLHSYSPDPWRLEASHSLLSLFVSSS
jgi:hypothetical protein